MQLDPRAPFDERLRWWLRYREQVAKDLGVPRECAPVEAERALLCDRDDVPVLEPVVGIWLRGA